jgi:hypothetical protein
LDKIQFGKSFERSVDTRPTYLAALLGKGDLQLFNRDSAAFLGKLADNFGPSTSSSAPRLLEAVGSRRNPLLISWH